MIHTGVKINIRGAQFQDLKLYRDCETNDCVYIRLFVYRISIENVWRAILLWRGNCSSLYREITYVSLSTTLTRDLWNFETNFACFQVGKLKKFYKNLELCYLHRIQDP